MQISSEALFARTLFFSLLLSCAVSWRPALGGPGPGVCQALLSENFTSVQDAPSQLVDVDVVTAKRGSPAYCRVRGYVAPQVGFELHLPLENWNKKYLQLGCGGHCGRITTIMFSNCPLKKGYACMATDTGHSGTSADALWAGNNWQAKIDWGYRAAHVAALAGKAIVERFYGGTPVHAYFIGTSTGARQALQEAQRFPWDFDGIVAIAPPTDLSVSYMTFAWGNRVAHDREGKPLVTQSDLQLVTRAALDRCDLDDGVRDGVIGDPLSCVFDPGELACSARQKSGCLSPAAIDAVRKIYAGPTTSRGERLTRGGPLIGSESGDQRDEYSGWRGSYSIGDDTSRHYERLAKDGLRYLFFPTDVGPDWKLRDFDFDRDYKRLRMMQALYDATNPDLRAFRNAGGKLVLFQGLNDNAVLPRNTIDYYEAVERMMGGRDATQEFLRLFLLPGVGHGVGGAGADVIDYLGVLNAWVEEGRAPDRIVATRLSVLSLTNRQYPLDAASIQFSRPVFPYPIRARYGGTGNPNDAANFIPLN